MPRRPCGGSPRWRRRRRRHRIPQGRWRRWRRSRSRWWQKAKQRPSRRLRKSRSTPVTTTRSCRNCRPTSRVRLQPRLRKSMDFAFSEEQEMLRRSAREFLAKECGPKVVRKLMEGDGYDQTLWKKIADLGWTALGIPEEYGGVGTFLDLVVVLEEAGRALLPGPFFSTMGLAVPALIEAGTEAQKKDALGAIASGSAKATLAFTEPSGRWDADSIALGAQKKGGGWQLDGVKLFVPEADVADYTVVVARSRGAGEEGITLFLVRGKPKGMTVKPLETLDMTRRWSEVRFDGVELDGDALMGAADKAWPQLKRGLAWAAAALCAARGGGTQNDLEASTDCPKHCQRVGKP